MLWRSNQLLEKKKSNTESVHILDFTYLSIDDDMTFIYLMGHEVPEA